MKRLVSIAIIVVLLAPCACSPAKRIVGEWKTQSTVLGVVVKQRMSLMKTEQARNAEPPKFRLHTRFKTINC